jgi:hypothetical protein
MDGREFIEQIVLLQELDELFEVHDAVGRVL